jgi:antitoxin ParD1/3/4
MTGRNTSIELDDDMIEYALRKVELGEFASISEVVADALRRAEARDMRIERLRELIREGEESGPPVEFDFDAFIAEKFPNA